jgi:hypothetical protein
MVIEEGRNEILAWPRHCPVAAVNVHIFYLCAAGLIQFLLAHLLTNCTWIIL